MLVSHPVCNSMASQQHPYAAAQVAEKVMRRVEIAKVARNLQDCLAFASFKAQNGWQDRTLSSIEPEFTEKLKRKRPVREEDGPSDHSSPSDDDFVPTASIATNRFSKPANGPFKVPDPPFASRKRVRASSTSLERPSNTMAWKQDNRLSQSSPVLVRSQSFQDNGLFHADTMTLPHVSHDDSPMFDVHSDDEDHDLPMPMPSFGNEPSSSILSSSPPRTPPPTKRLLNVNAKQAGADLLLYLANSPSRSPAINIHRSSKDLPSTPPSQHAHLPSSVMTTPGTTLGLFNGALQTPGQNFNLADFCNVTPSPGQAQWGGRTPNIAKTPSRFARRSLNFDTLQAPSGSPTLQRKAPTSHGLALQLGDELVPRG